MSLTNPNTVVTEQRLSEFYKGILPYMGGMPEMVANKFSKGDLYSTDEKMIGQWINGKPLYQRAFSLTIPTTDDTVYIAIESDIEDCIETFGYASFGDGTWMCLSGSDLNNKRSFYAQTSKSTSSSNYGKLRFFFEGTILHGKPAIIVAKYTKISDTAISIGSDTDYSTEEKIIGTFVDGKPIYQKTIDCGTLTSGNNSISHNISNIDLIVNFWGRLNEASGTTILINSKWGNSVNIDCFVNKSTVTISADGNSISPYLSSVYVTIQYTKTTT